MIKHWLFIFTVLCTGLCQAVHYPLKNDPIDVVIPAHVKDKETIDLCIKGIKKNCDRVRRIIVVSAEKLTRNAEWFDEKKFPFSIKDIIVEIGRGSKKQGEDFFKLDGKRNPGWYYQQLLKLYCFSVIPDLSSNLLVLDSDTIFLNPVKFLNEKNGGLFASNSIKAFDRYLNHAKRLVPGYQRMNPEVYSVCHHMLFQKPIMKDLFQVVENHHKKPFWKAFCACVDLQEGGASEYEIYYSFAFKQTDQVGMRPLKWRNSPFLGKMEEFRKEGYHFVSFHSYLRNFVLGNGATKGRAK